MTCASYDEKVRRITLSDQNSTNTINDSSLFLIKTVSPDGYFRVSIETISLALILSESILIPLFIFFDKITPSVTMTYYKKFVDYYFIFTMIIEFNISMLINYFDI